MKVAVVGASGYVGSRLVPELLRRGHDVVATHHRSPSTAYPWSGDVEWRRVDVHDEEAVIAALGGVDAICYLVHGLDDPDFMRLDRQAADNVAYAAGIVGATRLVYLSGIVPDLPPDELSDHLLSRLEVEQILATRRHLRAHPARLHGGRRGVDELRGDAPDLAAARRRADGA